MSYALQPGWLRISATISSEKSSLLLKRGSHRFHPRSGGRRFGIFGVRFVDRSNSIRALDLGYGAWGRVATAAEARGTGTGGHRRHRAVPPGDRSPIFAPSTGHNLGPGSRSPPGDHAAKRNGVDRLGRDDANAQSGRCKICSRRHRAPRHVS